MGNAKFVRRYTAAMTTEIEIIAIVADMITFADVLPFGLWVYMSVSQNMSMQSRMASNRRGNASASGQRGRNASNETRTRTTERFKWTYEQERKLIELFDEAISMSIIVSKILRLMAEYMVEKFNLAFNMNITYAFFKNKLDEFKKSYKM